MSEPKATGLKLAQAKLAEMRAQGIEVKRLTPTEKLQAEPGSRHRAIRAMCWECLGGEDCVNIRHEMAFCTDFICAIWHLRPYQHLCQDWNLWPHKHLDPANYGKPDKPYGLEKRKAAIDRANPREMEGKLFRTATNRPKSLASAIKAKCMQCHGGKMVNITHCVSAFGPRPGTKYVGCPLNPVRPYQIGVPESEAETEVFEPDSDDPESID